ncbi:MAG: helix-turn-helix transcriptional regulator [Solirubrobacterales bacterium]|nr:helix-turn-helix transcriptional regulator [Solirubrobacterales bacterium]
MLGNKYVRQDCSIAGALEVIGERWTLLIVRDAMYGVRRFTDFQSHLDIPKAVLSDRLAGLVEDGVLERTPDPTRRGSHQYELTQAGRELWPVLHALLVWGGRHGRPNSRIFMHASCQTELAADGSCPTCNLTPNLADIATRPRPGRARLRDDPIAVALRRTHRMLEPIETA